MNKRSRKSLATVALFAIATGLSAGSALAGGLLDVDFNPVNFTNARVIDNPYWPLNPDDASRIFTYEAETEDGCVINSLFVNGGPFGGPWTGTKVLTGDYASLGEVLEVLDIEWIDEECDGNAVAAEITFDWYAQDNFQNIWYMGEASRDFGEVEIDGEELACPTLSEVPLGTPEEGWEALGFGDFFTECTAGSWEAGIAGGEGDDAVVGEPGIVVPSDMPFGASGEPLENGTFYMQEVAFEAQDMAKILRQDAFLSVDDGVDPGEYENCRKVKEWNPFEPGESVEHKWYCRAAGQDYGPGLVLIEGIGGGVTEVETLTEIDPAF